MSVYTQTTSAELEALRQKLMTGDKDCVAYVLSALVHLRYLEQRLKYTEQQLHIATYREDMGK